MYLAIAGLLVVISSIACLGLLLTARPLNALRLTWGGYCIFGALWGMFLFQAYTAADPVETLPYLQGLHLCSIPIPLFLLHFSFLISGEIRKYRGELVAYYALAIALLAVALVRLDLFIPGVQDARPMDFTPEPGVLFDVLLIFFVCCTLRGLFFLVVEYRRALALRRQQLGYVFVGTILAFLGGGMIYLPVYNIPITPYGTLLTPFAFILTTLMLLRYELVNVRDFLVRTGSFALTCLVVIAVPFWGGLWAQDFFRARLGDYWWMAPVAAAVVVTAIGAVLLEMLRRSQARATILGRSRYEMTLLKASFGLGRNKDLGRLSRFLARLLSGSLRVDHVFIYLFDKEEHSFRLAAWRRRRAGGPMPQAVVTFDSPIVDHFHTHREPVVTDEVKLRASDDGNCILERVGRELDACGASVLLPCWIRERILGFVVLGPRTDRRAIEPGDLVFLAALSNQVAVALENALSFEDLRRTQEHLVEADKMATIGTLAGGLSHQLNNRFTVLQVLSKSLEHSIREVRNATLTEDAYQKALVKFQTIEDNIKSSQEVVETILHYASANITLESFELRRCLNAAVEMAGFKIRLEDFVLRIDIPPDLPRIAGNFAQLQEVFFNIIDNAHHALMEKKKLGLGTVFEPTLVIAAHATASSVVISATDNGTGVKPEDRRKLFTPFFSTKAGSGKGYGLGLYVMKQIIERNHNGFIRVHSDYGRGVTVNIVLPIIVPPAVEGSQACAP